MTCGRIRAWLHRDASALTDSDRLVLEDHLEQCADCRQDRALMALVRQLGTSLPARSIGPRGYQRAIAGALLERSSIPSRVRRAGMPILMVAGLGAVGIVIAIVTAGGRTERPNPGTTALDPSRGSPTSPDERTTAPLVPPSAAPSVELATAIASAGLTLDGVALEIGAEVPAESRLRALGRSEIALPATRVVLAAASEIRWSPASSTVYLDAGSVDLDVDPAARVRVRVVTPRFIVEVTGTRFNVSTTGVSVTRGAVRVIAPDGKILVRHLAAGESWSVPEPRPRALSPAAAALVRARTAFAALDYRTAERHAALAIDARADQVQTVEASMILAECAHALGRLDDASARYQAIAARFSSLPTGEIALFAAARLEAHRDRREVARTLFERYLELYPSGRFAKTARGQLDRVEP